MTKKAEIYYFTLTDELPREDKLAWFKNTRFANIEFDKINPDDKGNWLNLTDNDFDSLMPVCDKEVKAGKSQKSIFKTFNSGILTGRDEWVFDTNIFNLKIKVEFFIEKYTNVLRNNSDFDLSIKWSETIKNLLHSKKEITFHEEKIIFHLYRPFIKLYYYSDVLLSDRLTSAHYEIFGKTLNNQNKIITFVFGSRLDFCVIATELSSNYGVYSLDPAQCLPLYVYDKDGNPHDNITDWALSQFQARYSESKLMSLDSNGSPIALAIGEKTAKAVLLQKQDIFYYVYAVLHNPAYREKYEQNLKREFPRIPFYDDFEQWAAWGKQLMDLHLNYETVEKYPLKRLNTPPVAKPKTKLKADKINSVIQLDDNTSLSGITLQAWGYKLGNRSALEWVLDQYKEKKPKDPTIAEKFNTYRFADYKEQVIDLLMRVCTVSVETMKIIEAMKKIG